MSDTPFETGVESNDNLPATSDADVFASLLAAPVEQSKYATESNLSKVVAAGWLPYISLMGSNSELVKEGKCTMGHFYLFKGKENFVDLGPKIVMVLLAWRPKAMDYNGPKSFFDPESEGFRDVEARSEGKNSGCGFGPEFCVWLPEHGELAAYFLGSKTGRNEAPALIDVINDQKAQRTCIQEAKLIKGKEFSWHGPSTKPYEGTITNFPDGNKLQSVLNKFNNPSEVEVEVAEDDESDSRD